MKLFCSVLCLSGLVYWLLFGWVEKNVKCQKKYWETLWEFSLKPKQVEVWILKKDLTKATKTTNKIPQAFPASSHLYLAAKILSDLIFWNDQDFWAELLFVCFNSIPNNCIKFSTLRLSAKKSFSSEEVLKAFRLHKSMNCFSVSAHSKAGWLKRLLPAWTASGNIWHLSTDTYQDAFSVIGSHLKKVIFLSHVQVHEQICIFMFSAVKNC